MTLFINNYTTIGGGCKTLTLMINTSNSGCVYINVNILFNNSKK
jgi:hypothetical protein